MSIVWHDQSKHIHGRPYDKESWYKEEQEA